jgi:hypothetical protein
MSDRTTNAADFGTTSGRRSDIRLALALVTFVACWIAAYLAVVRTGKNTPLPWSGLAVCAAIGFGAVAAAGRSPSSRVLIAAWGAMTWSLACVAAYLSKTDILFGHYRGPFAWIQAATIGSWIGLACAIAWPVVRFGLDHRPWSWKTIVFGLLPLAAVGLFLLPAAGDFVTWQEQREREELSDPHSARSEIRRVDMLRRDANYSAGSPEYYRLRLESAGRYLQTPEGKAYWKQWEEEAKREGKIPP